MESEFDHRVGRGKGSKRPAAQTQQKVTHWTKTQSERSDWCLLGWDVAIRTVSTETVKNHVFLFAKAGKFKINKFDPSAIR